MVPSRLTLLAVVIFGLAAVQQSAAVKCYACTSARVDIAEAKPDETAYSYTSGGLNENGTYAKTDVTAVDFFKGKACDQASDDLFVVDCYFGCVKTVVEVKKKRNILRTVRQCAYPDEHSSRYNFGDPSGIKRTGATDGVTSWYYYCKDSSADRPCNAAVRHGAGSLGLLLGAVVLLCGFY